jgi:hypothetical protein
MHGHVYESQSIAFELMHFCLFAGVHNSYVKSHMSRQVYSEVMYNKDFNMIESYLGSL